MESDKLDPRDHLIPLLDNLGKINPDIREGRPELRLKTGCSSTPLRFPGVAVQSYIVGVEAQIISATVRIVERGYRRTEEQFKRDSGTRTDLILTRLCVR